MSSQPDSGSPAGPRGVLFVREGIIGNPPEGVPKPCPRTLTSLLRMRCFNVNLSNSHVQLPLGLSQAPALALFHAASTQLSELNMRQRCRRGKSAKQRHCLLRNPAEWFSRLYISSTLRLPKLLPKLLPPLRMRYVHTSYACHVVCASV